MSYIGNQDAIKYIKSRPKRSKQKWEKLFPSITPELSDLMSRMLTFNPDNRISAEECLDHPFFEDCMEDFEGIPTSKEVFDWSWDNFEPTKELLQNIVYEESLVYHPEPKAMGVRR